jgi:hypothetical protein
MPSVRRFLSPRWLLAFLGTFALLFGLAMLHPYPRQSLFGPTIRGKPWCVWEGAVRRHVHIDEYEKTLSVKLMRWMGVKLEELTIGEVCSEDDILPLLIDLADDPDFKVRRVVVDCLELYIHLWHESAIPALRRRLDDEDATCRVLAAKAIWNIAKDKSIFPKITADLENPDAHIRGVAMEVFCRASGDAPELYPHIIARVNDSSDRIRGTIMFHLYLSGEKAVPILLQGLEDRSRWVRLPAIGSLGTLGSEAKGAIPALERRMNDSDEEVREAVVHALVAIDPQRFQHLRKNP